MVVRATYDCYQACPPGYPQNCRDYLAVRSCEYHNTKALLNMLVVRLHVNVMLKRDKRNMPLLRILRPARTLAGGMPAFFVPFVM